MLLIRYVLLLFCFAPLNAQNQLKGKIFEGDAPFEQATIFIEGSSESVLSNENGDFTLKTTQQKGTLVVSSIGYKTVYISFEFEGNLLLEIETIYLEPDLQLEEVVISGNLKPTSRKESAVPIELYQPKFLRTKPNASLFEAITNINGIRPQINCSVCNTGDIHINGQEGANTMILIDGMPIVSGLGSVYGLMGIPASLIKNIEVIKGPASTLFGSEAIGGVININTIDPRQTESIAFESFYTNWDELNIDFGLSYGSKNRGILGVNFFKNDLVIDNNSDGFTDIVLQNRISIFNKWTSGKLTVATRYFFEDRWGGQTVYNTEQDRLSTSIYGEQISTRRFELFGGFEFNPLNKFQFSFNRHYQDAAYGDMPYIGDQRIGFIQYLNFATLTKGIELTSGTSFRYTYYDDNTPATERSDHQYLPGLFTQAAIEWSPQSRLLAGMRFEHHSKHGLIFSPRLNYKWSKNMNALRWSVGNGYRVVNLFTEDHAALSGFREVVIDPEILPEQSWNTSITYSKTFTEIPSMLMNLDISGFYSYFGNKIIPDYDSNPNEIRYLNLSEYAESYGVSISLNGTFQNGTRWNLGATLMDINIFEDNTRYRPVLTERFNAVYQLNLPFSSFEAVLSGNLIGPMRLPLASELDPRSPESPFIHLMNLQFEKKFSNQFSLRLGLRNLLNFTPPDNSIARAFDPFDREVEFDSNGTALVSESNPYGLTFDPSYSYTSFQGRNIFFGLNFSR